MNDLEKYEEITNLMIEVNDLFIVKFFDLESEAMLDEKIEVLTALKNGEKPGDIKNYYKVLELYPADEDGVNVKWD